MSHKAKSNLIFSGNAKIDGIYHTAEWLVTAFASTLVFIIFVMQVYRIPTGSMAETLRGAHFRLRCRQCGFKYDHDFITRNYGVDNSAWIPSKKMVLGPRVEIDRQTRRTYFASRSSHCPNCKYSDPNPIIGRDGKSYLKEGSDFIPAPERTVYKGDQIFVLKSIYQFFEPKRWDVIVFKNPTEPKINYIKRCIGLPGETLQIVDGDIFINGVIQRKPEKVQEELWMAVYNNDYQPAQPAEAVFNEMITGQANFRKVSWKQPFELLDDSQWDLTANGGSSFRLNSKDKTVQRIRYNDQDGNRFRAMYAYDDPGLYPAMPICSDLMIQYEVDMPSVAAVGKEFVDGSSVVMLLPSPAAGAQISKYGITYQGWVKSDGTMQIIRSVADGDDEILQQGTCNQDDLKKITRFRFTTLDHQVILQFGDTRLVHDLGTAVSDAGENRQIKPEVEILGYGELTLSHIGVYRDIHYLSNAFYRSRNSIDGYSILRATEEEPLTLDEDQFFACGDNSPASYDSRLWKSEGLGNNGNTYAPGVVPRDYLVGKAMFVHWPGGFRIKTEPIRWIPFIDGMKVIYGGKD